MPRFIEPSFLATSISAIRTLVMLVVQSLKLQARLLLAIGTLAASECVFILCLLVFPIEVLLVAALPLPRDSHRSPSHSLAACGLYLLERIPLVMEGQLDDRAASR